ncbi:MAG: hypothetical protein RLO38_15755 [Roseovarius confluentis]
MRPPHDQMVGHFEARRLAEYFGLNQQIHEGILIVARNEILMVQYRSLATQVRRAWFVADMTARRCNK